MKSRERSDEQIYSSKKELAVVVVVVVVVVVIIIVAVAVIAAVGVVVVVVVVVVGVTLVAAAVLVGGGNSHGGSGNTRANHTGWTHANGTWQDTIAGWRDEMLRRSFSPFRKSPRFSLTYTSFNINTGTLIYPFSHKAFSGTWASKCLSLFNAIQIKHFKTCSHVEPPPHMMIYHPNCFAEMRRCQRMLTSRPKKNSIPFVWGKYSKEPDATCLNASSLEAPKDTPTVPWLKIHKHSWKQAPVQSRRHMKMSCTSLDKICFSIYLLFKHDLSRQVAVLLLSHPRIEGCRVVVERLPIRAVPVPIESCKCE